MLSHKNVEFFDTRLRQSDPKQAKNSNVSSLTFYAVFRLILEHFFAYHSLKLSNDKT